MERLTYLLAILLLTVPILVLQWLVALDVLWTRWKVWLLATLLASVYLIGVDAVALNGTLWSLNPTLTTGLVMPLLNTPFESGLFYLLTSLIIVQTLLLLVAHQFIGQRLRNWWGLATSLMKRKNTEFTEDAENRDNIDRVAQ